MRESFGQNNHYQEGPQQGVFGEVPEIVKHPQALERANQVTERARIDIDSFADLYGEDNVAKDKAYVEKRKAQFHANDFRDIEGRVAKENAEIIEAILFQEGDGAMWFGEDSAIIMPTEYDDIANGIDSIIEIERQNGLAIAALSIDVTYRKDFGSKIDGITNKIDRGHMARIKYYQSELGNMRGEKTNVPHFVVGVGAPTLAQLTNLFAEKKSEQFATHQVQFQIIESIHLQADAFAQYALESGHPAIAKEYERISRIFKEIYEARNEEVGDQGKRDSFFDNLKRELAHLG